MRARGARGEGRATRGLAARSPRPRRGGGEEEEGAGREEARGGVVSSGRELEEGAPGRRSRGSHRGGSGSPARRLRGALGAGVSVSVCVYASARARVCQR